MKIMTLEEAIKHCKEKSCGNNACALEHKQLAEWLNELKKLRLQNIWKPSDAQMEILQYLCETSSHPNEKVITILESLYQDLKKLKEE